MLWRALGHVKNGCYIDVGAQSPDVDSVSRLFHERGWHGTHVEPTPDYAAQLRQSRPEDLVVQAAIGATAGSLTFYEITETGLSTSKREIANQHAQSGFKVCETVVPAMTLDDLFAHVQGPDIHWLKIDVEGGELDVLQGWVTSPLRPWVVVVESTLPLTKSESHAAWEPLLTAKGYRFTYFDGLNRFYVCNAHEELLTAFTCGPNVFDNFSLASSSAFCATVNIGYHALEQRRVSEQQTAQAEIERLGAKELAQQAGFETKIEAEQRRSEALVAQAQLDQAKMSALRDAHLAQIDRYQAHVAWLDGVMDGFRTEKQAAQTQTDAARREAHRWWLEAEELRRGLARIKGSHSWRITAPVRGARRLAASLVRSPRQAAKDLARPAVVWAMRRALTLPFLRARALQILEAHPPLKVRFRNLALSSGLIQDHLQANRMTLPQSRPNTPRHMASHTALSSRASKVLADLRHAIQEKHG